MTEISIRKESQISPVADEVSALIAVVRPIVLGLLFSLKHEVAAEVGGFEQVKLKMLPRLRLKGDGDVGICYEYAVHDAIRSSNPLIKDKISETVKKHCNVKGTDIDSILFATEKSGVVQIVDQGERMYKSFPRRAGCRPPS